MKYYTYILYSDVSDRFYTGSCTKLEERLRKHNLGSSSSTRPYRPWRVIYHEEFDTKTEALKRELAIKKKKSRKYIEALVRAKG